MYRSDSQPTLFDDQAPWEADSAAEQLVASVVLPTGPKQTYSYLVPESLSQAVEPGRRVRVPFGHGNRSVIGYCVEVGYRSAERKLKSVAGVVDERSLLSGSMLRLTRWMADYYLCDWGQVLEAVVPAAVREQAGTRLTTLLSVPPETRARLDELKLSAKQAAVVRTLLESPRPLSAQELARAGCTQAPIAALRRKGVLAAETRRLARDAEDDKTVHPREDDHVLNADQQQALDTILHSLESSRHETVLLHGITGSGKTEVYIRAIQEVVRYGRQAIVLVPEISLTPQTRQRFQARFGNVAVLHSHLSDADRHRHWQRIARGDVSVVVGARSAVFAPVPHLGLIVLDEEHESSFKQETAPRYHARDVALRRASEERVPLVLGSATPALESYERARRGEYRLVEMPRRVFDRPLPEVLTVDLRHGDRSRETRGVISRQLHQAMNMALADGGQVILLLNRRGFSTHIQCQHCGEVLRCPHCEIAMTHHRAGNVTICHYCDFQTPAPRACPHCHAPGMHYGGTGTQKLEAEVRARFPDYRTMRMDTDTMQGPGSHERALAAFRSGEVQILLGTQMIAKGLDFPAVTLVGVINADTALHLPDFRAAERTCQLLVQVAGRTGRGNQPGRVLVQTFNPDHVAIRAAASHDYRAFANLELPVREALAYPPFASMARLVVRGPVETVAGGFAEHLAERLRHELAVRRVTARVLGPAPAPIAKLRGLFRFQIQAQAADGVALRAALAAAVADVKPPEHVQWIVDVDPLDMM
ncbi:MAG TPA: primosomal protein N' [Pirellulales bacterium]|jgi:primosomal protein N' (replication factor Y)|nr:primosomal protein N' [Pirellulales bacterium]